MASLKGVKRFLTSRVGRILMIVIAVLVTAGAFLVGGVLFAIVAAVLFGLGLPIWVGASQPRYLAVVGIAILAASPAILTAIEVPIIMTPIGPASTSDGVLQNATVTPFVASAGSQFNWSVQIFPNLLPTGTNVVNLTLYLSTCPGATGNNSPSCTAGYPFFTYENTTIRNITAVTIVRFSVIISSANLWSWQMILGAWNYTSNTPVYDQLVGDAQYNGLEGPITADWGTLYYLLVSSIYIESLIYIGLTFFVALLIYVIYRLRRQRNRDAQLRAGSVAAPKAPASVGSAGAVGSALPSGGDASRATGTQELACPNCGAVVYPKETFCWKCGTSLTSSSSAPPSNSPKG